MAQAGVPTARVDHHPPKLLTVPDAAAWLGMTPRRVYRLVEYGILPCVRIRRQVRFTEPQLRTWIDQGDRRHPEPDRAPGGRTTRRQRR